MARLTGIISKLNGSVGNLTFRQNGGLTIVSEEFSHNSVRRQNEGRTKAEDEYTLREILVAVS